MKFSYGNHDFKNKERGQEQVYLLTNGLGGYSSLTLIQSITRNDHGLFVAALEAPIIRYVLVSKVLEQLSIDGTIYHLTSQEFVDYTKNTAGEQYLVNFTQEYLPQWHYIINGVELIKRIVMVHDENTLAMQYEIRNETGRHVELTITPALQFCEKGTCLKKHIPFHIQDQQIQAEGITMYVHGDATLQVFDDVHFEDDVYYAYDARDGRTALGTYATACCLQYTSDTDAKWDLIFSLEDNVETSATYITKEIERQQTLIRQSGVQGELAKTLVRASDQFVVKRDSSKGKTIIAGYPFFADWGRDTMYALEGCTLTTRRFDDAKNIFRTFVQYTHKGLMPNLFKGLQPSLTSADDGPLYNTVDASLLFMQALYYYYQESKDLAFVRDEMMPTMASILDWYEKGTDFDIYMDGDGLISAGSGLHQLTWMDIRYQDELPTPRHGKAVEINAYWYNALCTYVYFAKLCDMPYAHYEACAQNVYQNFTPAFWNETTQCLKDLASGSEYDHQIRCNQIWAVSVPFSPLDEEKALLVVQRVKEKLYTPYGLRTLAIEDPQFVPEYSGHLYKRDMSYHQGTVWTFPLGSYFRAYLNVHHHSAQAKEDVRGYLSLFEDCLREGCVGQIPEIYDGLRPDESRGCFAQAWSVAEILKICKEVAS